MELIVFGSSGRLGRLIIQECEKQSIPVIGITRDNIHEILKGPFRDGTVVIEATHASVAPGIIDGCMRVGYPILSLSTGWFEEFGDRIMTLVAETQGVFEHTNNTHPTFPQFLTDISASLSNKTGSVHIHEAHHVAKTDWPSGTARSIAQHIFGQLGSGDNIREVKNNSGSLMGSWYAGDRVITFDCERKGETVGIHTVSIDNSPILRHEVTDRSEFARGAIENAYKLFLISQNR